MANFFDDEPSDEELQQQQQQQQQRAVTAGPSRQQRQPTTTTSRRTASPEDDDDDNNRPLPPPLALRNGIDNKGKGRAVGNAAAAAVTTAKHARASSTMSIDNYYYYDDTTTTTRVNGRTTSHNSRVQQGNTHERRGFLDDNDDDDIPNNRTRNGHHTRDDEDEDEDDDEILDGDGGINTESDIQHLMRLYMDERMSPELLKWDEGLIGTLMQNLEAQTEATSVLLSSGATSKPDEHERLLLVQMEIERVRWLLRSYLRTRTFKIEKQAQYLLKTPLARLKMSDVEQGYAERYHSLVIKHFQTSVTGNIPERLGRLDEDEMVVRPELDQAVFARARRDCPPITLPDAQLLEMKKGEIHLVRYRSVRALVRDGYVRLV